MSFQNVTSCIFCLPDVKWRSMSVYLIPVGMVVPVWIVLTCLCVNAHLATAVQPVTLMYVGYIVLLILYCSLIIQKIL